MNTHPRASVLEDFAAAVGISQAGFDAFGRWNFVADTLLGKVYFRTEEIYETILSANFLSRETCGPTIGVNRNHRLTTLGHRVSLDGIPTACFTQLMEDFINVAALWKDHMPSGEVQKDDKFLQTPYPKRGNMPTINQFREAADAGGFLRMDVPAPNARRRYGWDILGKVLVHRDEDITSPQQRNAIWRTREPAWALMATFSQDPPPFPEETLLPKNTLPIACELPLTPLIQLAQERGKDFGGDELMGFCHHAIQLGLAIACLDKEATIFGLLSSLIMHKLRDGLGAIHSGQIRDTDTNSSHSAHLAMLPAVTITDANGITTRQNLRRNLLHNTTHFPRHTMGDIPQDIGFISRSQRGTVPHRKPRTLVCPEKEYSHG